MKHKRLVDDIINDPFIDIAFIYPLISRPERLKVLERQASAFLSTGDIGENTSTYREYKDEVGPWIIEKFGKVYEKTIKKLQKVVEIKAKRAWTSLLMLLASQNLMKRMGVGLGDLLPEKYADLAGISSVVDKIIEEKTKTKGVSGSSAIKRALQKLNISGDQIPEIAPLFWWINIMMESEVFEAVFKFHYLVYSKASEIKSFGKSVEDFLLIFRDHEADYEYVDYEIRRSLLSRCAELRSQYINKLNNAIIFVKFLRRSIRNPERWEWFVYDEILTYIATIYITEIQRLLGLRRFALNISSLAKGQKGMRSGAVSSLASLILLSPIFMQYSIEAYRKEAVTPADIIIAVLRLTNKRGSSNDYIVSVNDVINEILEFWNETDILRRLKKATKNELSHMHEHLTKSFSTSLALLINAGIEGIHVSTMKKPDFKLPPRSIGYDSIFVRPLRLLSIINKLWEVKPA